jgi:chloramphenicol-sensitive protein RarD
LILIVSRKQLKSLFKQLTKRTILIYTIAGVLLAGNWFTYVWGVNAGYVIETSLGYFINPLVSFLLGVVILREKLRPLQWVPISLAVIGVVYLTISYGRLPWIALTLAFSFGFYGLIKKIAPLGSIQGLMIETAALFIPAIGFLLFSEFNGSGVFGHISPLITFLLILSGVVTAIPLILFAQGAPKVPLVTIGIIQYIAPTLQFLIGVFLYNEPFTNDRLIGFSIIWLALAIFTIEGLNARRQKLHPASVKA